MAHVTKNMAASGEVSSTSCLVFAVSIVKVATATGTVKLRETDIAGAIRFEFPAEQLATGQAHTVQLNPPMRFPGALFCETTATAACPVAVTHDGITIPAADGP